MMNAARGPKIAECPVQVLPIRHAFDFNLSALRQQEIVGLNVATDLKRGMNERACELQPARNLLARGLGVNGQNKKKRPMLHVEGKALDWPCRVSFGMKYC